MNIIQKPSPHFYPNRIRLPDPIAYKPIAIVLHIMEGTLAGTDSWFQNPASSAASTYGVGKNGEVHQYVQEKDGAWCNGVVNKPSWSLLKPGISPNLYTLNIEHEGYSTTAWSEIMKQTSAQLVHDMAKRWNIPLDRLHVIGHYEIDSVNRPNCPAGNKAIVDEILARALTISGVIPPVNPPSAKTYLPFDFSVGSDDVSTNGQVSILQSFLNKIGYSVGNVDGKYGPMTQASVKAFQTKYVLYAWEYATGSTVGPRTRGVINDFPCG